MTVELPAGVDAADVRRHAVYISIAGTLINHSGAYLTAEPDSPEEVIAQDALDEFIERVVGLGPETMGGVLLALAAVITQTGDVSTVQAWFDEQGKYIAAALAEEDGGD